jgi:hypothetical protein
MTPTTDDKNIALPATELELLVAFERLPAVESAENFENVAEGSERKKDRSNGTSPK